MEAAARDDRCLERIKVFEVNAGSGHPIERIGIGSVELTDLHDVLGMPHAWQLLAVRDRDYAWLRQQPPLDLVVGGAKPFVRGFPRSVTIQPSDEKLVV